MSQMWKRREQTHHCGNTYWKSTMEWWQYQYSPTLKWNWFNSFPSHREEKPTRVWGYLILILTLEWIQRMNSFKSATSICNLWGELEFDESGRRAEWGLECGRCVVQSSIRSLERCGLAILISTYSGAMEWRFSLYFSLLTSERSRDKPGRRSPEGVGGGGWRGRRRRVGEGRQEEWGLQAFIKIEDFIIYAFRWPSGDFLRWKALTVVSLGGKRSQVFWKRWRRGRRRKLSYRGDSMPLRGLIF